MIRGEDECDDVYRAYKCFWDGVHDAEAQDVNGIQFSFYDVLGFNRLYDEAEVLAEKEATSEEIVEKVGEK